MVISVNGVYQMHFSVLPTHKRNWVMRFLKSLLLVAFNLVFVFKGDALVYALDFCTVLCTWAYKLYIVYNETMNHCNLRWWGKFLLWTFLGPLFTVTWKVSILILVWQKTLWQVLNWAKFGFSKYKQTHWKPI